MTEDDEIEFLRNLDAFLCLLEPRRCEGGSAATAANAAEKGWPEVRSKYLSRLMRGMVKAGREGVVEKWVEGKFGKKVGVGAYVRVVDGFLGVLEGRGGEGGGSG